MFIVKYFEKIPSQIFLLIGIALFIFVFPIIDNSSVFDLIGPLSYSIITLSILSVIQGKRQKKMKFLVVLVLISVALIWVMHFSDTLYLSVLSFVFSISVFFTATVILITQIARSKEVNVNVILETISAYLLIGVMFTLTNTLIGVLNHDAFLIKNNAADFIYYSFITLTTTGFGDITPQSDFAKMASVFFGLCGQLYLTIIMAFIIGKYLNSNKNKII